MYICRNRGRGGDPGRDSKLVGHCLGAYIAHPAGADDFRRVVLAVLVPMSTHLVAKQSPALATGCNEGRRHATGSPRLPAVRKVRCRRAYRLTKDVAKLTRDRERAEEFFRAAEDEQDFRWEADAQERSEDRYLRRGLFRRLQVAGAGVVEVSSPDRTERPKRSRLASVHDRLPRRRIRLPERAQIACPPLSR
jgi:hypothetical protein